MTSRDPKHAPVASANPLRSGPSEQPAPQAPAGGQDRQAGQEADRIDATLRNNEEGFGKKDSGQSSARQTAQDVAKRQGQRDG